MNHQVTIPVSVQGGAERLIEGFDHSFLQVNDMTPNARGVSFDSIDQDFGFVWRIFGMVGQNMKGTLDELEPIKYGQF